MTIKIFQFLKGKKEENLNLLSNNAITDKNNKLLTSIKLEKDLKEISKNFIFKNEEKTLLKEDFDNIKYHFSNIEKILLILKEWDKEKKEHNNSYSMAWCDSYADHLLKDLFSIFYFYNKGKILFIKKEKDFVLDLIIYNDYFRINKFYEKIKEFYFTPNRIKELKIIQSLLKSKIIFFEAEEKEKLILENIKLTREEKALHNKKEIYKPDKELTKAIMFANQYEFLAKELDKLNKKVAKANLSMFRKNK